MEREGEGKGGKSEETVMERRENKIDPIEMVKGREKEKKGEKRKERKTNSLRRKI